MSTDEPQPKDYAPPHTHIEVAGDMLCAQCFQPANPAKPLKACSACRRVSYCSTACQKRDWKTRHKQFCPQFHKVNKYDKEVVGEKVLTLAELDMHQTKRKSILQSKDPAQHEPCGPCCDRIIKHEIVCEVCRKTPAYHATAFKAFASCPKCGLVRYCSDTCRDALGRVHSPEDCATLRLLHATERTQIDYHLARKKLYSFEHLMSPSPEPRRRYTPLAKYTGFDHFHRELSREFSDSSDITLIGGQMATEAESIPLTVIAGLEAAIPNIATRKALEIHFVAAGSRELCVSGMTEDILHHFPSLKTLSIHYVGPEASTLRPPSPPQFNRACAECKGRGSHRSWTLHAMEYHQFLKANPGERADIIVGLNTGWSEVDVMSWASTIKAVCALKIPVLFTAYSELEALREKMFLQTQRVEFLVDVQENKWRGVIPIVNKGIRNSQGILASYSSYYWYVFRGQ
ncbi:hypothetical protein B0H12DRAFT_1319779 [Mycena haematopus]|nr:hypothetical protein B0H12DRAFT_1319779 [Mycena haematopus]